MPKNVTRSGSTNTPATDAAAKIDADFKAAATKGKITTAGADKLIAQARTNKLTESEANAFKADAQRYGSSFEADAKTKIDTFISGEMPKIEVLDPGSKGDPGPIKDPAVLKGDTDKLEQQDVKGGKLFIGGVSGKDPQQNYIGDCYLIASMSAVARENPQAINDAFKQNADGTYTVRIFKKDGSKYVPQEFKIDGDLPRNDWQGAAYASDTNGKELWPALLEKAFAERAGSYGKIEAGIPGDAMSAITGKPSTDIDLRGKGVNPDDVFKQIDAAVKAHKPATAVTLSDSSAAKYKGTNIYTDHTYTIWGTTTENGTKYVELRNPWGESEPTGNGPDDGIFKLPLDQFMSLYCGVSING